MKQYNNEKAIISLTSWKKRIITTSRTIFSLLENCPGFHIVLVLSEQEFPNKEKDLPEDLVKIIDNNLIEVLWIYPNYRSFKKVFFTIDKYPGVPVISADDGCKYIKNYAEELYQKWLQNKDCIISYTKYVHFGIETGGGGWGILYPPGKFDGVSKLITPEIVELAQDDGFVGVYAKKNNIKYVFLHNTDPFNDRSFVDMNIHVATSLWTNFKCSNNAILEFKRILEVK